MSSYFVNCLSCGAKNRVQTDKEGMKGRCGSCKAVLPPLYYQPQQLNNSSFDAFIANYPGPVLAEFWAPWCHHCVSFAQNVRTVAEKLAGKAAVAQINTEENQAIASRFGVRGIPVIILLRNGKEVSQLAGKNSVEAVLTWFKNAQNS